MDCYRERSHLLALLSCHYPSTLFTPDDAEEGYSLALCMDIGGSQATWHIADSDLDLFSHLEHESIVWDGHTTDEKYRAIADEVWEMSHAS